MTSYIVLSNWGLFRAIMEVAKETPARVYAANALQPVSHWRNMTDFDGWLYENRSDPVFSGGYNGTPCYIDRESVRLIKIDAGYNSAEAIAKAREIRDAYQVVRERHRQTIEELHAAYLAANEAYFQAQKARDIEMRNAAFKAAGIE